MIRVETLATLQQCLLAYRSILFIHFDWSGQSMHSLKVFEMLPRALEERFPRILPTYFRVDPEKIPDDEDRDAVFQFLTTKPPGASELSGGGFGSVVWMIRGKIVAFEPYAAKAGLDGLILKTEATIEDADLRQSE